MRTSFLIFLVLLWAAFWAPPAFAQHYITSFGIRVSEDLGLTLQQRVSKFVTIEGMIQSSRYRYYGTVLGQWHHRLLTRRLNFYLGGGGHWGHEERYGEFYGFTPVVGLELNLARLNISADYKPAFNLQGDPLIIHSSGLSVRYILIRHHGWRPREKLKKWWKSDKNFFRRKKKD